MVVLATKRHRQDLVIFIDFLIKTIIPLTHAGYEMIRVNSGLRASFISNPTRVRGIIVKNLQRFAEKISVQCVKKN